MEYFQLFSLSPSHKGTYQQLVKLDMAALHAGFPHFVFSSMVRDLGIHLYQEFTCAPHIHLLNRACYNKLRQLRTVARLSL